MALSPQQLRQFRTQGFVKVEGFYSAAEIEAMRLEIQRFKRVGLLRNVVPGAPEGKPKDGLVNLQLCPMYNHSDLYRALPFDPKVVPVVSQLIGDPVILHLDQVFVKPGRHGSGTSWHQDNAYFKIAQPMLGTAMWIAVHDATVANGTLEVIPGAFDQEFEHVKDPLSDHHIRMYPPEALEKQAVPIEMKAGGVVFFCYGTPHCTRGNNTDRERAGVAYHFLHESVAFGSAQAARLISSNRKYNPYLSGPRASGGLEEYGVNVAGTWPAHVDRVLREEKAPAAASA